jgi:hypothetical protein
MPASAEPCRESNANPICTLVADRQLKEEVRVNLKHYLGVTFHIGEDKPWTFHLRPWLNQ